MTLEVTDIPRRNLWGSYRGYRSCGQWNLAKVGFIHEDGLFMGTVHYEEAKQGSTCSCATMLPRTQRQYFSGAQRNWTALLWSMGKEPRLVSLMPSLVSQQTSLLLEKGGGVWCGLNSVL